MARRPGSLSSSIAAAPLEPSVAALVRHFRRQRPVRGGSLIISIFGDSIAPRGGSDRKSTRLNSSHRQ